MSVSGPTSGSSPRRGTRCYRTNTDPRRHHLGPFQPCAQCRNMICHDCIGGYAPNGKAICVECAAPDVYGVRGSAGGGSLSSMGPALGSVGSGARGVLDRIWGGVRWVGRELAEPFRARPGPSGQFGGDLRVWLISSDVVFEGIVALIVVLVAIVVMILVYGLVNEIPLLRVTVAIFGAASFWVFVAIQILYRLQRVLGPVSAMVISFLLAFVLAVPFVAWLIFLATVLPQRPYLLLVRASSSQGLDYTTVARGEQSPSPQH